MMASGFYFIINLFDLICDLFDLIYNQFDFICNRFESISTRFDLTRNRFDSPVVFLTSIKAAHRAHRIAKDWSPTFFVSFSRI